jgi:hypothetical protein
MFSMYFLLHFIIYLEKPACTLIYGRREYLRVRAPHFNMFLWIAGRMLLWIELVS